MIRTLFLRTLIIIWFLPVLVSGQEPYKKTLDSLYQSLTKVESISEKDLNTVRDAIMDLSEKGFQDLAESMVFQFLKLADEKGNLKDQASLYYILGRVHRKTSHPDKALEAFGKSLDLYKKAALEEDMAPVYSQMGNVYYDTGQNEKAIEAHMKSLSINQKYGNKKNMAYTLSGIGFILADQKRNQEAMDYFRKSFDLAHSLGDSTQMASSCTHLGITQHTLKELDSSLYYFKRSLAYAEPIGFDYMVGYATDYIGKIYTDRKEYVKAKEYLQKGLELRERQKVPIDIVQSQLSLAWLHIYLNEPAPALNLAEQALKISKGVPFLKGERNANETLSKAHEMNGDHQLALKYFKDYKIANDSLFTMEERKAIDKANTQIKVEQETYGIKLEQAKQQSFFNTVLIVLATAFVLLTIGFFHSRRKQRQKNRLTVKLKELEAERKVLVTAQNERKKISRDLHDDLGTTISAIKLVVTNSYGNDKSLLGMVEKANNDVREFFTRLALSAPEDNYLSTNIKTTMENLNRTGRATFEYIEVGDESLIPADHIEPLSRMAVELMVNVAKHAQATECTVQLLVGDNEVQLMVEDNGKGFDPKKRKKGMGLDNIYARAQRWNGEVHISSSETGTTTIITIPNTTVKFKEDAGKV